MSGKSSPTVIEAPKPPAVPSSTEQAKEYYSQVVPLQFAAEQQYGPQFAQSEYELQQRYAPLFAQLDKNINESLYPETAGLQENLARQANEGMTQGLPDDIRQQYTSDFNAGLGMNVNAPIGVSDRNVALTQLNKQWGDYYRNLGLSVAQRQPLAQGQQQQFQSPSAGLPSYYGASANAANTTMQGYSTSLANRIVQPNSSPLDTAMGIGTGIMGLYTMGQMGGAYGRMGR